jgi:hypothetical protein
MGETVMSKITLVRLVTVEPVVWHGKVMLEDRVEKVGIKIVDDDGRAVTLAFDGRCDRTNESGGWEREEYGAYSDCPIMTEMPDGNRVQSGPVEDIVVALRDALNALK